MEYCRKNALHYLKINKIIILGCVLVSSNVILQKHDELREELKGEEIENVETDRSFIPSNGWIYRNPIFPSEFELKIK